MVSHELRTPLTSIIGSASTLLGSSPSLGPVEMAQFHRIIHQQAESMRDLISELLDEARIEAGELSVFPVAVEAASLVDEARNTFLSGGGRNNIHIDIPLDLPLVLADRRRIVRGAGQPAVQRSKGLPRIVRHRGDRGDTGRPCHLLRR